MRKNIEDTIYAFKCRRPHNEKTCSTDGHSIKSYNMLIARREIDGTVAVVPEERAPSNTTRGQIRAVMAAFPDFVRLQ